MVVLGLILSVILLTAILSLCFSLALTLGSTSDRISSVILCILAGSSVVSCAVIYFGARNGGRGKNNEV